MNNFILILFALVSVVMSGLFSGAETGLYQFSRIRLRLGVEQRRLSYVMLSKAISDSRGLLFSTLLGTNLFNYITTSMVTVVLLQNYGDGQIAEGVATLIIAPVLFVFAELVPKSVFFYRADVLMPCVSGVLLVFHKLFTWVGIVPVLKGIAGLFSNVGEVGAKSRMAAVRRSHVKAIVQETVEEGFLSPVQSDIINRLTEISHLGISSVMIPVSKVEMVEVNSNRERVLGILKRCAFTRLIVYESVRVNIIGFVNVYDCLGSGEQFEDLRGFVQPIRRLGGQVSVAETIGVMQGENEKIICVTLKGRVGRKRAVGIVTMKDLVEELVGELSEW